MSAVNYKTSKDGKIGGLDVRTAENGLIVRYHQDGESKECVFLSWEPFITWLESKVLPVEMKPEPKE